MASSESILRNHALRLTGSREEILDVFLRESRALSQREIELEMEQACDRVTIYRTLSTFLEKGLLHKVLDDSGVTKFALCSTTCVEHEPHQHDHVHFKCVQCGNTLCVEEVHVHMPILPSGYAVQEMNVLMQGVCPDCGKTRA
ncbi:MAG: transcriptional repressor [Bacteroidia bacterium]|nr:transcriptional repressor [Bacteroidia bacterium]